MAERLLSGNDFGVYLSEQTAKGAIDASPVFTPFRRTEGKARQNVSYVQSSEVKTNRQARENVKDNSSFAADLSVEFTKQTVNYLIKAIQGTEATVTATATTIASDANGFVASTGTPFSGMAVGDYLFVSGYADTTLNRNYRITAVNSSLDVEVSPVPTAVEAAGASVTFTSQRTSSASTIPYYTVQTRMVDTSKAADTDYQTFYDGQINSASFEIGESGMMTGALAIVAEALTSGTAEISGQTDATADSSSVLSAVNDVVRIWVDGADSVCTVKSAGFEFSNNMQEDRAAGCEGATYANGDMTLTGALAARLPVDVSSAWRDRYINGTNVALAFELDHGGGDYTIIEVPQAVITEHEIPDGSGVVANSEMTYTAEEDSRGYTCVVYRNWS
jgi:hypothetical protein